MGKSWCDKSDEGKIVILQRTLKTFRFLWSEGRPVFDTGIQGTLFQANEPGYGRFIEQGGGAGQSFNSRGRKGNGAVDGAGRFQPVLNSALGFRQGSFFRRAVRHAAGKLGDGGDERGIFIAPFDVDRVVRGHSVLWRLYWLIMVLICLSW